MTKWELFIQGINALGLRKWSLSLIYGKWVVELKASKMLEDATFLWVFGALVLAAFFANVVEWAIKSPEVLALLTTKAPAAPKPA